jgi:hypothetical protein
MTQLLSNVSWMGVVIAGVFLWVWIRVGRQVIGQQQFPNQWIDSTPNTQAIWERHPRAAAALDLVLSIGLAFALALLEARRNVSDVIGAALVGILVSAIPLAVASGQARKLNSLRKATLRLAIPLAGVVTSAIIVFMTRP